MDEPRKAAYRHLLYFAMLDIRMLCQWRARPSPNPFEWRRQYLRSLEAGALADWLHNLADFAADDFRNFDEAQFRKEYDWVRGRYPNSTLATYKNHFERALDETFAR